jgi:hypothetical protein
MEFDIYKVAANMGVNAIKVTTGEVPKGLIVKEMSIECGLLDGYRPSEDEPENYLIDFMEDRMKDYEKAIESVVKWNTVCNNLYILGSLNGKVESEHTLVFRASIATVNAEMN